MARLPRPRYGDMGYGVGSERAEAHVACPAQSLSLSASGMLQAHAGLGSHKLIGSFKAKIKSR